MCQRLFRFASAAPLLIAAAVILSTTGCATMGGHGSPVHKTAFAKVDGTQVYYESYGKGSEAVVFIHAWSTDHVLWRHQIDALKERHRVIAMDLPGHGRSDKPEREYTVPYFADAVVKVCRDAGVKHAIVVGSSMGGTIAWELAREHPELVAGFVSIDGVLMRVPTDPAKRKQWQAQWTKFIGDLETGDYTKKVLKNTDMLFTDKTPALVKAEVQSKFISTPKYVGVAAMRGMSDPNNYRATKLDMPVLVINAKSQGWDPDTEAWLRGFIPKLQYEEWDGVGHFPMLEEPERVNVRLAIFTESIF
jgi:3-oxoadipate enol-lactonase